MSDFIMVFLDFTCSAIVLGLVLAYWLWGLYELASLLGVV